MADEAYEIRVRVDTEDEQFPCLSIQEIGNPEPGDGFDIPVELWENLGSAYEAVDAAERAVLRHIAERYPNARAIHEWLTDG